MMRREFLIAGCAALLFGVAVAPVAAESPPRPPSFLIILMDNIGQDWFGCYGSLEGQTPNIDRLAKTGLRFRHCYVMPLCSTSRHVFLTGRYPFRTGWTIHHDASIYGGGYFDWNRETSFARALKTAGYATVLAGKWQLNNLFQQPDALKQNGFDGYCVFPDGPRGHPAHGKRYWDPYIIQNGQKIDASNRFGPDVFTDFLIDFMKRHRDEPFLAFYSMSLTHLPATETPRNRGQDLTERQKFAGMVRYADHCIGRLVAALEELDLRRDTIVVATTDNGTPAAFGGRVQGRTFRADADTMVERDMNEGEIDVPFVVNGPGRVPAGRLSEALLDFSDLFPTLVELAGAASPQGVVIDGKSFASILRGAPDAAAPRQWMFSQYASRRVVRNHRYKLRSDGRFHDLQRDPLEEHDLSADTHRDLAAQRKRLQQVLDALPADAPSWFVPRSISARRLGIGEPSQRATDARRAPSDPTSP